MIRTEQTVRVNAAIEPTWAYARDMRRWAGIMPGYQSCDIIDQDTSRWVLKVGVGAMVRTVRVVVHVDRWAGPEAVDFHFQLENDPVEGDGSYRAEPDGPGATRIRLNVRVTGGGPMAPMWEAMGGPVLPKVAQGFAEQLKTMIEDEINGPAQRGEPPSSLLRRVIGYLRALCKTRPREAGQGQYPDDLGALKMNDIPHDI